MGNFNLVFILLVVNFVYIILRLIIKRKIIEVLREEYIERLELVVKGRYEVEEDIFKYKLKIKEFIEFIVKRKV